jgi:hypothetical protein
MTIDERIQAMTMNLELLSLESERHTKQLELDGQHIRELARIAQTANDSINALLRIVESHERRITHIDGGNA